MPFPTLNVMPLNQKARTLFNETGANESKYGDSENSLLKKVQDFLEQAKRLSGSNVVCESEKRELLSAYALLSKQALNFVPAKGLPSEKAQFILFTLFTEIVTPVCDYQEALVDLSTSQVLRDWSEDTAVEVKPEEIAPADQYLLQRLAAYAVAGSHAILHYGGKTRVLFAEELQKIFPMDNNNFEEEGIEEHDKQTLDSLLECLEFKSSEELLQRKTLNPQQPLVFMHVPKAVNGVLSFAQESILFLTGGMEHIENELRNSQVPGVSDLSALFATSKGDEVLPVSNREESDELSHRNAQKHTVIGGLPQRGQAAAYAVFDLLRPIIPSRTASASIVSSDELGSYYEPHSPEGESSRRQNSALSSVLPMRAAFFSWLSLGGTGTAVTLLALKSVTLLTVLASGGVWFGIAGLAAAGVWNVAKMIQENKFSLAAPSSRTQNIWKLGIPGLVFSASTAASIWAGVTYGAALGSFIPVPGLGTLAGAITGLLSATLLATGFSGFVTEKIVDLGGLPSPSLHSYMPSKQSSLVEDQSGYVSSEEESSHIRVSVTAERRNTSNSFNSFCSLM